MSRYDNYNDYDDEFDNSRQPRRGSRDIDWSDHIGERADGRQPLREPEPQYRNAPRPRRADDYDYDSDYPSRPTQRRSTASRSVNDNYYYPDDDANNSDDRSYRTPTPKRKPTQTASYNEDEFMPPQPNPTNKPPFRKRHPVVMNLIYIICAMIMLGYTTMWFLDFWTFHGQERVVPDVKGQAITNAIDNINLSSLRAVVTDSVFDSYMRPGTVVEQTPIPGAKIKKGGSVYLIIVAYTPKLITVPDFYNMSSRQARSVFEGLGIHEVREVPVISEYAGLVLGAKFNGVALQPGAKIPISAVITLEVGSGFENSDNIAGDLDSLSMIIDSTLEELNLE